MNVSIHLVLAGGEALAELQQAFCEEAPAEWDVSLVPSIERLLPRLADTSKYHLVVISYSDRAAEIAASIHRTARDAAIVVVAQRGNVDLAAEAIQAGATDFLVCGDRLRQRIATLLGKLTKLFEVVDRNRILDEHNVQLREAVQSRSRILGTSPQVRRLLDEIRRVAAIPRPLLIVGERGTGKELVARAIHGAAGPDDRPMVTVNCAAFNDALLESELFGHEKGAFTGAETLRRGKFEQADGGTLFLDEIGNMSLSFQEKILRVVEYGHYARVGGTADRTTSARIIAATNRDLQELIEQGEFLADLRDRLTFETIRVPPLRERHGDVEVLARHFLEEFLRETPSLGRKTLAPETVEALRQYPFPGNVRELKNLIERAAYRDTTAIIAPHDLGLSPPGGAGPEGGSFQEKLDALATQLLSEALRQAGGNQKEAASLLGLKYHQMRYYLKKYVVG
ncbi:MAG: sigma-54-dependent transcriptional regulator [Thermoguttaceae bacterium]